VANHHSLVYLLYEARSQLIRFDTAIASSAAGYPDPVPENQAPKAVNSTFCDLHLQV
jgi:hypothetical protein